MSQPPTFDAVVGDDLSEIAEPEPVTRRALTLGISMIVSVLLLAGLAILPAPYAIRAPGPTEDTLGKKGGTSLITISGAPVSKPTGQLRLTTVSVSGGPGYPVTLAQVIRAWVDKSESIQPVEEVFPPEQTQEESEKQGQEEMISSQENATVAALTELGYTVPATLTIDGTATDSGADGVIKKGDVITGINGKPVVTYQDLIDGLAAVKPGADVKVDVLRDKKPTTLTVTTTDDNGQTRLGVFIDPTFDFPVDVKIKIDDIGGPSAGTMFALGIIDLLTPEDEAKGKVIAGTGTMSVEGDVGEIGGIEQKMYGAKRDGATWFLAPDTNCNEVKGSIPSGLHVAKIHTLEDARNAVKAIGEGKGDTLPTCR